MATCVSILTIKKQTGKSLLSHLNGELSREKRIVKGVDYLTRPK